MQSNKPAQAKKSAAMQKRSTPPSDESDADDSHEKQIMRTTRSTASFFKKSAAAETMKKPATATAAVPQLLDEDDDDDDDVSVIHSALRNSLTPAPVVSAVNTSVNTAVIPTTPVPASKDGHKQQPTPTPGNLPNPSPATPAVQANTGPVFNSKVAPPPAAASGPSLRANLNSATGVAATVSPTSRTMTPSPVSLNNAHTMSSEFQEWLDARITARARELAEARTNRPLAATAADMSANGAANGTNNNPATPTPQATVPRAHPTPLNVELADQRRRSTDPFLAAAGSGVSTVFPPASVIGSRHTSTPKQTAARPVAAKPPTAPVITTTGHATNTTSTSPPMSSTTPTTRIIAGATANAAASEPTRRPTVTFDDEAPEDWDDDDDDGDNEEYMSDNASLESEYNSRHKAKAKELELIRARTNVFSDEKRRLKMEDHVRYALATAPRPVPEWPMCKKLLANFRAALITIPSMVKSHFKDKGQLLRTQRQMEEHGHLKSLNPAVRLSLAPDVLNSPLDVGAAVSCDAPPDIMEWITDNADRTVSRMAKDLAEKYANKLSWLVLVARQQAVDAGVDTILEELKQNFKKDTEEYAQWAPDFIADVETALKANVQHMELDFDRQNDDSLRNQREEEPEFATLSIRDLVRQEISRSSRNHGKGEPRGRAEASHVRRYRHSRSESPSHSSSPPPSATRGEKKRKRGSGNQRSQTRTSLEQKKRSGSTMRKPLAKRSKSSTTTHEHASPNPRRRQLDTTDTMTVEPSLSSERGRTGDFKSRPRRDNSPPVRQSQARSEHRAHRPTKPAFRGYASDDDTIKDRALSWNERMSSKRMSTNSSAQRTRDDTSRSPPPTRRSRASQHSARPPLQASRRYPSDDDDRVVGRGRRETRERG